MRQDPAALVDLAVRQLAGGGLEEARRTCERVLKAQPDWAPAHALLGETAVLAGDLAAAERHYRRALQLAPDVADARFNLANTLYALERRAEAIELLRELLSARPEAADARQQLVVLLQEERRFDEMDAACREGMARAPREPFYPNKLGVALWWRGRHAEALDAYRLGAERGADPRTDAFQYAKLLEASALLTLGRYREGWEAYHGRDRRFKLRARYPELIDDPRKIAALDSSSTIRICPEQGLGDEIFFLRFARFLRARGHQLIVRCERKLVPVLTDLFDIVEESDQPAGPKADFTVLSGDLPLASAQNFAPPLALPVKEARRDAWAAELRRFGPAPYIGVTWRSGILPDEPRPLRGFHWLKELPPEQLAAVLRPLHATVVILQRRPSAQDQQRFAESLGRPALDLSEVNDDLRDALAVLSLLDDYVGPSNTNTHLLAGIPGKSQRLLVLNPPEWRWGLERVESPWFPGFRLYRKELGKDWGSALSRLAQDLSEK